MTNRKVEDFVRALRIPQLEILKLLAESSEPISTTQEIRNNVTHTSSYSLGALLTPLRRRKIEGETLIVPAGLDVSEGKRWQINERLCSKQELKELLISMNI